MPQADFYVLPAADPAARPRFCCRLAEKIAPDNKVYIHCQDETEAERLNNLLWSFKEESFVPHRLVTDSFNAPVTLGWQTEHIDANAVFVNLTQQLPEIALTIERVVEIVVQTPEVLQSTRKNYKDYQQQNYQIRMNDMRRKK